MASNPGRTQERRGHVPGRLSSRLVAWAVTSSAKLSVYAYPGSRPSDEDPEVSVEAPELGNSVSLVLHSKFEARSVKFILTHMTGPELEAFDNAVKHAISLASPTVELRDKIAREAFENGDDSHERSYRSLPTLVVRERKE